MLVDVTSKKNIKTSREDCPLVDGAWVEFFTDLTGADQEIVANLRKVKAEKGELQEETGSYELLEALISDWNFADTEEKKLEISAKIFPRLSVKMQKWLIETAANFVNDGKKKELPVT